MPCPRSVHISARPQSRRGTSRRAPYLSLKYREKPLYNLSASFHENLSNPFDSTCVESKEGPTGMTYIIAEPCVDVKDGACVDVCPVDCIYTTDDDNMYYISPEECIDCAACEPVCPVVAIFAEDDTPEEWNSYIDKNYVYSGQSR